MDTEEKVLDELKTHAYDLVFLDLVITKEQGNQVVQYIRENITRDIPVLGLTGNLPEEVESTLLAAGMQDFIIKPVDLAKMKEKILRWTID